MDGLKALVNDHVKSQHITKAEFAKQLGITRSAFYAKLGGYSPWYLDEAVRLSRLLDVPLGELAKLAARQ